MLQVSNSRFSPRVAVWLLGLSQIVGYGTLYYSLSIMAANIAATLAVPVASLYGALSAGLLLGGLAAPLVGRAIDRVGAGTVMAGGSLLAAAALLAAAWAPSFDAFAIALVLAQVLAGLVQYDAAFAALVQLAGTDARLRIMHLTLIAGFASTIFWPLTGWLLNIMDWRQVLMLFSGLNLVVCLPIHALLARQHRLKALPAPDGRRKPIDPGELSPQLRRPALILVALGFALSGFALSALLAQMVPLLHSVGVGSAALLVSALFGPAQVLVRFVNLLLGVKRHPMAATVIALTMLPAATVVLMLTAPTTAGALAFVLLLGFGSGLKSIVQGTLPLALFGDAAYGARLGVLASVRQMFAATAPFALSWLSTATTPMAALAITAALAFVGLLCILATWRLTGLRPSG